MRWFGVSVRRRRCVFSSLAQMTCLQQCQKKNHLTRKVGFEGTPKLGPCLKSKPVTCKANGNRIKSMTKDNSHSWVRISMG